MAILLELVLIVGFAGSPAMLAFLPLALSAGLMCLIVEIGSLPPTGRVVSSTEEPVDVHYRAVGVGAGSVASMISFMVMSPSAYSVLALHPVLTVVAFSLAGLGVLAMVGVAIRLDYKLAPLPVEAPRSDAGVSVAAAAEVPVQSAKYCVFYTRNQRRVFAKQQARAQTCQALEMDVLGSGEATQHPGRGALI